MVLVNYNNPSYEFWYQPNLTFSLSIFACLKNDIFWEWFASCHLRRLVVSSTSMRGWQISPYLSDWAKYHFIKNIIICADTLISEKPDALRELMKRCYTVNMFRARWQGRGLYFPGCAGQIQGRDARSSSSSRSHCSHTGRRHWWCCASETKLALHPGEFTWNLRKTALGHHGVSIASILHLVGTAGQCPHNEWTEPHLQNIPSSALFLQFIYRDCVAYL